MTANIRKLIASEPFIPFTIHTANGRTFRVPTVDHIAVPPSGKGVFVFGDGDDYDVLSPWRIAHLTVDRSLPAE